MRQRISANEILHQFSLKFQTGYCEIFVDVDVDCGNQDIDYLPYKCLK